MPFFFEQRNPCFVCYAIFFFQRLPAVALPFHFVASPSSRISTVSFLPSFCCLLLFSFGQYATFPLTTLDFGIFLLIFSVFFFDRPLGGYCALPYRIVIGTRGFKFSFFSLWTDTCPPLRCEEVVLSLAPHCFSVVQLFPTVERVGALLRPGFPRR